MLPLVVWKNEYIIQSAYAIKRLAVFVLSFVNIACNLLQTMCLLLFCLLVKCYVHEIVVDCWVRLSSASVEIRLLSRQLISERFGGGWRLAVVLVVKVYGVLSKTDLQMKECVYAVSVYIRYKMLQNLSKWCYRKYCKGIRLLVVTACIKSTGFNSSCNLSSVSSEHCFHTSVAHNL